MSNPTIIPRENGPYSISQLANLKNSKNESIPVESMIALCRCGHSSKKPFCDGTHAKVNFKSKNLNPPKNHTNEFDGKKITIIDIPSACSHAGFCDGGLPNVFWTFENGKRIAHPNKSNIEEVIQTIKKCPSGSLTYKIDNEVHDKFTGTPTIVVSKNGPLEIRGSITLNHESKPQTKNHYTLCRCGASKNKPFCDGAHFDANFKDDKN